MGKNQVHIHGLGLEATATLTAVLGDTTGGSFSTITTLGGLGASFLVWPAFRCWRDRIVDQLHDVCHLPQMIRKPNRHSWGHSHGTINPDKVVPDGVKGDHVAVVLKLLAVRVGQSCEPAHVHSKRQIAALNVAGADLINGRISAHNGLVYANAGRRAVACVWAGWGRPENFDELREIDLRAESRFDSARISGKAITRQLNPIG